MKEGPILFSAPMVRAILAGHKSQTRRVVKPQPSDDFLPTVGLYHPTKVDKRSGEAYPGDETFGAADDAEDYPCPYGQPGDRLWVRETWQTEGADFRRVMMALGDIPPEVIYRADKTPKQDADFTRHFRWRPSIFMPRWASRITLEIAEVRVERLQEITFEDAKAEGVPKELCNIVTTPHMGYLDTRSGYRALWYSINGKTHPWSSNPWVWVVGFKRIEQAVREAQ